MLFPSFRNKILLGLFLSLIVNQFVYSQDDVKCQQWVDSVFSTMSPDERIGQLFVYNTPAQNDKRTLATLLNVINQRKVGGLLFWDGSLEAQADLTNKAQEASKIPLFITLDGEWGLSMRLKNALRYPKKMTLSALTDESLIYDFGAELGRQCNEMRINVNFDPVLDVNLNPENPVINTRSFGDSPQEITRKADAFIRGLHSRNVMAVGKHFPGHGDTSQDSHQQLAVVTHTRGQLDSIDMYPFKQLMKKGLDGIMVGHLSVPAIDTTGTPASLSSVMVDDLLKKELNFQGLVFTDAMKMKAVSDTKDATIKALLAGNDIILDPYNIDKEIESVKSAIKDGKISMSLIDAKCKKVLRYKYLCGLTSYKPIQLNGLEARVNTIQAKRLQVKLGQQSVTVFKNDSDLLPLKNLKSKKIALVSVGSEGQNQFKETLSMYDSLSVYSITSSYSPALIHILDSLLTAQDLIIFSIHNTQVSDSTLAKLCEGKKKIIQAYFISTYQTAAYKMSIAKADACVLGYENLQTTQSACAQSIFGGINTIGKLPVAIKDLYPKDRGLEVKKTRLGYGLPEDVGLNSSTLNKIDSIANDAIAQGATPGCQVLVARKGMVVYQKSFGYHDYTNTLPVKNSDIYDLASVSKISATLPMLMKLYDEDKIDLDDRLPHFFPELKKTNKKLITIKDLLTHQAGLPAFVPFYQQAIDLENLNGKLIEPRKDSIYTIQIDKNLYANKNYKYKSGYITKLPDSIHTLQIADSMFILQAFKDSVWDRIVKIPVNPERKYLYSDLSFLILQKVAEKSAKMDLDKFVSQEFYKELGATTMGYNPTKRFPTSQIIPTERDSFLRKQLLLGYVHDQNAAFLGGVAGHAGLFANANDMAKLYQMILNGGTYGNYTYLSKETCDLFTTEKSPISRRGLGFDRHVSEDFSDSTKLGHVMYGHTGFTGTCVWIDPQEEIIYIFLSNRIHPESWNKKLLQLNVRGKIEDVIYEAIEK